MVWIRTLTLLAVATSFAVAQRSESSGSTAEKIMKATHGSVVAVEATIEMDFGDMAQMMQMEDEIVEQQLNGVGIVLRDGLVAVPTAAIEAEAPGFLFAGGGDEGGPQIDVKRTALHIVGADGKRHDAQVVGESKTFDVSFLAPKNGKFGASVVDVGRSVTGSVGWDLLAISRLPKKFGYAPRLEKGYAAAAVTKPATGLIAKGLDIAGAAVFDSAGRLVGVTVPVPSTDEDGGGMMMMFGGGGPNPFAPRLLIVSAKELLADAPKAEAAETADVAPSGEGQPGVGFGVADADKDGSTSKDEFNDYVSERMGGVDDDFIAMFFEAVDADKNGTLSAAEFEKRFEALEVIGAAGDAGDDEDEGESEPVEQDEPNEEVTPTPRRGKSPKLGDKMREIVGEDVDGVAFKLSDYQGKVIMLDFWGSW